MDKIFMNASVGLQNYGSLCPIELKYAGD